MSFFQKYGKPAAIKKAGKALSTKDLLKVNIGKQKKIIAGEQVLGAKKAPIKSWFAGGKFNPKVGIYSLFGDLGYTCEEGKEAEMLKEFEKGFSAGEFDNFISGIAKKRKI